MKQLKIWGKNPVDRLMNWIIFGDKTIEDVKNEEGEDYETPESVDSVVGAGDPKMPEIERDEVDFGLKENDLLK